MNILITGSNGQLGTEMRNLSTEHPNHRYFFTDVAELDITDKEAVQHFVQTNAIDFIVNCAAYTNVDKAEEDEPTAHLINARAVENLALASLSTFDSRLSTLGLRPDFRLLTNYCAAGTGFELFEEVVSFVINKYKCGEIFHFNLPNSFHAEFGILHALDGLDIILRKNSGRATYRTEVESPVLLASIRHVDRAITFSEHD